MPLQFTWLIESCWIFGQSVCLFYSFASFHLSSSSVHNVALIAMDRYFALNNPFFYSKQVSVKLSVIVASLNWAVSFIYNFALLYFNDFFTVLLAVCPGDCPAAAGKIWSVVDFVVVFVLPCSLMCILYIRIFTIVKRHIKRINIQRDNHNNGDVRRSERKAAKVLGIVVSVFLLCLVPYYICSFMSGATHYLPFDELINYTMALFYLNSSVNPVIYALFYPWFQKCIKLLLSHHICRADSSLIKVK
ncbi:trace amine-associated receptor 13c-like [Denticeps clupeoides]|uniref:trace amine-associated receptor 13c-like n=1 Tax=Denticeps clupeoides TaxID=299321 RepID=UPI0010A55EE5|nr:trace amine-associated receptor 13c-like [Denticeps clupeoides]